MASCCVKMPRFTPVHWQPTCALIVQLRDVAARRGDHQQCLIFVEKWSSHVQGFVRLGVAPGSGCRPTACPSEQLPHYLLLPGGSHGRLLLLPAARKAPPHCGCPPCQLPGRATRLPPAMLTALPLPLPLPMLLPMPPGQLLLQRRRPTFALQGAPPAVPAPPILRQRQLGRLQRRPETRQSAIRRRRRRRRSQHRLRLRLRCFLRRNLRRCRLPPAPRAVRQTPCPRQRPPCSRCPSGLQRRPRPPAQQQLLTGGLILNYKCTFHCLIKALYVFTAIGRPCGLAPGPLSRARHLQRFTDGSLGSQRHRKAEEPISVTNFGSAYIMRTQLRRPAYSSGVIDVCP